MEKLQNKIQTGFENHGKESSPAMRNSPRDKNKYWAQKEKKEELGDFIKINVFNFFINFDYFYLF